MAPIGPANPDKTDEYLRDVMGVTDEGMELLTRRAEEKRKAAESSHKPVRSRGYRLIPESPSEDHTPK